MEMPAQSGEQESAMDTRFHRSSAILVLTSLTLSALYADVTARYKTDMTMNPAVSALRVRPLATRAACRRLTPNC